MKESESYSCPTLWTDPTDRASPGFSVRGILQARILEWVARNCLLQGNLLNPVSNSGLLHCRQILYRLSQQGRSGHKRAV